MTLLDIISRTLSLMELGTDAHTIENYREQFTHYANEAVMEILRRIKQERCDTVELSEDLTFGIDQLERECSRVVRVEADGKQLRFWQKPHGSGVFYVSPVPDGVTTVDVYYRYIPKEMVNTYDVPEIPNYMHHIIPYYVQAMERCGGDPNTQATSNAHFQIFNQKLYAFEREARGEPSSFSLLNY